MNIPRFFIPKHQSNIQRMGFAMSLIAMVALIFLHNPIDGYQIETTEYRNEKIVRPKCTRDEVSEGEMLQLKGRLPLEKWHELNFGSLPEGFETWPFHKQIEWQRSTYLVPGDEIMNRCVDIRTYYYGEVLPISEWRSSNPLVAWFGTVIHLLGALFAVAVAAIIWLVVFQQNEDGTA